ncbi:uncharacterized protein BDV14DRAFT_210276 [Aspergillus stella-maris]|uniref:uncharacterized protein n=1 Tax=Aspergillus stella-maris TaxID=1810926 RepID=UPI003CCD4930
MEPPAPRRRNVTARNRSGCLTCRERRLKCDEGRPNCHTCTRSHLTCAGYTTRIKFKDQTNMVRQRHGKGNADAKNAKRKARQVKGTETTPAAVPAAAQLLASPGLQGFAVSALDDFGGGTSTATATVTQSCPYNICNEQFQRLDGLESPQLLRADGQDIEFPDDIPGRSPLFSKPCNLEQARSSCLSTSLAASSAVGLAAPQHLNPSTIVPQYMHDAAIFPEDIIYYYHLRDTSAYGTLSILSLHSVFDMEGLDTPFFHAALALSALEVSLSSRGDSFAHTASIHALEHFHKALGSVQGTYAEEHNIVVRLTTLLLLANFELQRGQLKPWYIHSRPSIMYLEQQIDLVAMLGPGKCIVRAFSRIAALVEIFNRSYSHSYLVHGGSDAADATSRCLPTLEEESRSSPGHHDHWQHQATQLIDQLKAWRHSLSEQDVPLLADLQADAWMQDENGIMLLRPLVPHRASNPARAATNFMHYLVSLVRLETKYSPGARRQLPRNADKLILIVCRLAAGVGYTVSAAVNAYGHGMVPAMMNAYYLSEAAATRSWVKQWIMEYPREREGLWNEYHCRRGTERTWEIIKVRMVDLEEGPPEQGQGHGDEDENRLSVEIYSRCKRGWSIDVLDIP